MIICYIIMLYIVIGLWVTEKSYNKCIKEEHVTDCFSSKMKNIIYICVRLVCALRWPEILLKRL